MEFHQEIGVFPVSDEAVMKIDDIIIDDLETVLNRMSDGSLLDLPISL